jgi:hypothetical protein
MRSRILLALSLAACLALLPGVASGGTAKRTRALTGNIQAAVIGDNGDNGRVFAGELRGRPILRAAAIVRNKVEGTTSTGTAILYARRGIIRARITNEIQPQPDGSVSFPGTFRILGGTRAYRGATGSGSFGGTLPAGSTIYSFEIDGRIRY